MQVRLNTVSGGNPSLIGAAQRHMLVLMLPFALAACAGSRGGNIPYEVQDFGQPDLPSMETLASDYRIAPMDKIIINVFQADKLSGEYKVDLTGHIAMPLLGNIMAAQKTPGELQAHLAALLEQKLLKNPDVTVGIAEAAGSMVTIDGSVKGPGGLCCKHGARPRGVTQLGD